MSSNVTLCHVMSDYYVISHYHAVSHWLSVTALQCWTVSVKHVLSINMPRQVDKTSIMVVFINLYQLVFLQTPPSETVLVTCPTSNECIGHCCLDE